MERTTCLFFSFFLPITRVRDKRGLKRRRKNQLYPLAGGQRRVWLAKHQHGESHPALFVGEQQFAQQRNEQHHQVGGGISRQAPTANLRHIHRPRHRVVAQLHPARRFHMAPLLGSRRSAQQSNQGLGSDLYPTLHSDRFAWKCGI